jgi:hypothetical protein
MAGQEKPKHSLAAQSKEGKNKGETQTAGV